MLLRVPLRDFLRRLTSDDAPRLVNLPADFEVIASRVDAERNAVALVIRSQTFQRISVTGLASSTQTQPYPQVVAVHGTVRLQMPIQQSRSTAIGYHSAADGAMTLSPLGRQANEGVVQRVFHAVFGGGGGHPLWYQLDGGSTSALDVGASPGTDVYAPVDGTVVGVSPYVLA